MTSSKYAITIGLGNVLAEGGTVAGKGGGADITRTSQVLEWLCRKSHSTADHTSNVMYIMAV